MNTEQAAPFKRKMKIQRKGNDARIPNKLRSKTYLVTTARLRRWYHTATGDFHCTSLQIGGESPFLPFSRSGSNASPKTQLDVFAGRRRAVWTKQAKRRAKSARQTRQEQHGYKNYKQDVDQSLSWTTPRTGPSSAFDSTHARMHTSQNAVWSETSTCYTVTHPSFPYKINIFPGHDNVVGSELKGRKKAARSWSSDGALSNSLLSAARSIDYYPVHGCVASNLSGCIRPIATAPTTIKTRSRAQEAQTINKHTLIRTNG